MILPLGIILIFRAVGNMAPQTTLEGFFLNNEEVETTVTVEQLNYSKRAEVGLMVHSWPSKHRLFNLHYVICRRLITVVVTLSGQLLVLSPKSFLTKM